MNAVSVETSDTTDGKRKSRIGSFRYEYLEEQIEFQYDNTGGGKSGGFVSLWHRLTTPNRHEQELQASYLSLFIGRLFKVIERRTTIRNEIRYGCFHFFSCCFILAVNPSLLMHAGYRRVHVAAASALVAGISCIFNGLVANMPFILAPTTSMSLYFAFFMQHHHMSREQGNFAVFLLGLLFFLCGFRTIALFLSNVVPFAMKVGICLGVSLLVALRSLSAVGLVKKGGADSVLDIGDFTAEIYIAMGAFVLTGLALHYRMRGSFLVGVVSGTLMYWLFVVLTKSHGVVHIQWYDVFVRSKDVTVNINGLFMNDTTSEQSVYRLVFDMFVIGTILLNGMAHGLSEMAGLKREDGSLPRGKWLYAACGIGTILSAFFGAGPIMIVPESAPGIKTGARTGLSSVVCGILLLMSTCLSPLLASVPPCATSPVLLLIGMMLFENAGKVNWISVKESLPVFIMCVFIPFTYSIFNGVVFGFSIYIILYLLTDDQGNGQGYCKRLVAIVKKGFRKVCCCCKCFYCCCSGKNNDTEANVDAAGPTRSAAGEDSDDDTNESDTFNDVAIVGNVLVTASDQKSGLASCGNESSIDAHECSRDSSRLTNRLNLELHQRLNIPRSGDYTPPHITSGSLNTVDTDEGYIPPAKLREARYIDPSIPSDSVQEAGVQSSEAVAGNGSWSIFSFLQGGRETPRRFNAGAGALLLGSSTTETPDWVLN